MDGQGVGRKERCDGGKERSRDRGDGVAVENEMESVPKGEGGDRRGRAVGSRGGNGEAGG